MPTAENAILYYEAGQNAVAMLTLTDQGDHKTFKSAATLWSDKSGKKAVVRPQGLATGGVITPADSETSDYVDVAALTAYIDGVLTSVAAETDLECPRPDAAYLLLSFASDGYTECAAGDIGKAVAGTVTTDSGTLIAYNNTTRQWVVEQDDSGDTFDDDDEGITITEGTGAGTLNAVGAACTHKICSVTVTDAGAVAVVEGTEGTSFDDDRGEIGGPPYIPAGSIEIGQIRYTAVSSAAVDDDEIFQVVGSHQERYDYPTWTVQRGVATGGVLGYAGVTFDAEVPQIHTGGTAKEVWASYYTPIFAEVPRASEFKPAETTHSVSSKTVYGSVVGSKSSSLAQSTFNAELSDGVADGFIGQKNETLWFRFHPDRLDSNKYILTQGTLGVNRSFPAGDSLTAACTISAESASMEVNG